jgi:iron complex transport system ATP-binding protein
LIQLLKLNQEENLSIITVLHDVNLAARYSSRIALLSEGVIFDLGTPEDVLTPPNLANILGVDVAIMQTPVGLQICPISPCK